MHFIIIIIINNKRSHMLEIADVYINHVTMVQTGLSFNPQMEAFWFYIDHVSYFNGEKIVSR